MRIDDEPMGLKSTEGSRDRKLRVDRALALAAAERVSRSNPALRWLPDAAAYQTRPALPEADGV